MDILEKYHGMIHRDHTKLPMYFNFKVSDTIANSDTLGIIFYAYVEAPGKSVHYNWDHRDCDKNDTCERVIPYDMMLEKINEGLWEIV